jgi:hypothetical protein
MGAAAMVKALALAFRWRKVVDEGVHATLEDLAKSKGIAKTYVSQILRLTLLAPGIVEAILDGRQPAELLLDVSCGLGGQRRYLAISGRFARFGRQPMPL